MFGSKTSILAVSCGLAVLASAVAIAVVRGRSEDGQVPLVFSGGHETDRRDHGRPVVLVAAGLGVPGAVFREAFSHVTPAPAGERPDPEQVRLNKEALLSRLSQYGVDNELLDKVSDYYRYRPEQGRLWRHRDAEGYAIVEKGKILKIVVTDAGAGYTTPPDVIVNRVRLKVKVAFGKDLEKNGSIAPIQ